MMDREGTHDYPKEDLEGAKPVAVPEQPGRLRPTAETGLEERTRAVKWITLIGAILGLISVILYVVLYFQEGAWQILADAAFVALAVLCMIPARWLASQRNGGGSGSGFDPSRMEAQQRRLEMAGHWILLAIMLAWGGGTLVWAGATLYNAVGGILLIFLVATTIRPRRWTTWLGGGVLFLIVVLLLEWLVPLPRYDISQSSILRLHVPLVTGALVLLTLWQVVRFFRIGTIRTRLLIAFVSLALLPVVLLGIGVVIGGLQSARQQSEAQLVSVAVLKRGAITTWLDDLLIDQRIALSGGQVLTNMQVVQNQMRGSPEYEDAREKLAERLGQVLTQSGRYRELVLIDAEGQVLVSTDPDRIAELVSSQLYFTEGLKGPYIQRPTYSMADNRSYLFVSQPVLNKEGQVIGVLAGEVSIDRLNEVMAERTGLGETGQTYLVAFNHTMLTPSRTGEVNVWVSSEGVDNAVDNQASNSGLYDDFRGVPVVGAYGWLPELESALIAEQEQSEAFQTIYTMLGIAAAVGLLGIGLAAVAALLVTRSIATPLADLADTATEIAEGDLTRIATVERNDEIGALATAFNSMTAQLRGLIGSLEQRVADRTRDLEQRSSYLLAAAEVGRTAASILETETLVQEVVELIRKDFGLYYVGLFLLDPAGEWAELQAGTGEAGLAMMARGHRLHVGGESMIGWSIANRQARIALEAGEDAVRLATPELPDTRSEAALPLLSRGRVMGALSVQHTMPGAFDQDTIVVLQTMADQVAVALDNASLFADRQEALEAVQRAYGEVSSEAWHDLLRSGLSVGYRSDERGITEAGDVWRPEMEQALRDGRLVRGGAQDADGRQPLAVPIKVRGEVVGVLDTYKPAGAGAWTLEEVSLLEEIVEQLDVALEGARLHQDAQRRAVREETIRRVTERMRRPREVDAIVQSTLAELTKALGVPRAYVRLGTEAELSAARKAHAAAPPSEPPADAAAAADEPEAEPFESNL